MSSPGGMSQCGGQWSAKQQQGPPINADNGGNEDGISIRPMRLKVLYTFDDQNKTNCLARGEDVLKIKTVAMDETASIGILDLKTCIETVIRCSPELLTRVGQDYTVYAYDFSEYDNPLVGQGMLSRVLAAASPNPDAPAQQSQKLITGRVCKNILGIFNNGVKETLEVKLRLVPVPTAMQGEYVNTMEKYRENNNNNMPTNMDHNEWTKFLQSNPTMAQMASKFGAPASTASNHRGSTNMEVVNQLLSPSLQQQQQASQDPFNQTSNVDSGNESRGGNTGKTKKTSRPSSRAAVKRPRAKRQSKAAANAGGNTSGYEEGTDGDDGPAPRKRAKITQTDWNSKSSFGTAKDSLRVTASTAGSLRMFRPIAMSPAPGVASHLQEIPRAPTPVPKLPNQQPTRDKQRSQSSLRRGSTGFQAEVPRKHVSPYPPLDPPEDLVRDSIESANASPERSYSPADTPSDIGSSPPLMRTASVMRSSPPSRHRSPSQDLPQPKALPRMEQTIDSGFASGTIGSGPLDRCTIAEPDLEPDLETTADVGFLEGTLDDLFGDNGIFPYNEAEDFDFGTEPPPYIARRTDLREMKAGEEVHHGFRIEEETPGPMEFLPTRMPVCELPQPKATQKPSRSRGGSVVSEDGQTLPLLKSGSRPPTRRPTPNRTNTEIQMLRQNTSQAPVSEPSQREPPLPQSETQTGVHTVTTAQGPPAPSQSRRGSKMLVRTASMGSLSLPAVPASDPVLPPSSLQRSQTWTEVPHPATEALVGTQTSAPMSVPENTKIVPYSRTLNAKKDSIRQKLETAIANGEMPPFCSNCGAIETPTWRKAWSQEHTGAPGYYEYSDAPGRVTTIVILARDNEGSPTLYQLVKKYLGPGEDQKDWKEFILCNPCGIWMSKYKSHRPEERWESNKGTAPKPPAKRPTQRASRAKKNQPIGNINPTSDANFPLSDIYHPPSEAYYPQSEAPGPMEGISPPDTAGTQLQHDLQVQRVELPTNQARLIRPAKRLNAMTSNAASAALRRAIQSSPARWVGAQHSPIDVEDEMGSTRRLLFPSPRKDGSPKVLGELETNIVQIATGPSSPKVNDVEAPNKENYPPVVDTVNADAELLAFFEAEIARPTTPVQKSTAPSPFKTPTRPTPNHRPITRSVSKSIRSARSIKSPGQLLTFGQRTPSKTPSSLARRRSPRNHHTVFESPFTATINQLMSEANDHMEFGNLPDLPIAENKTQHSSHSDIFNNLDDFFSTDAVMPSSPPRMFHLYEDPAAMTNVDWNQFSHFDDQIPHEAMSKDENNVEIKEEQSDAQESLMVAQEMPQESGRPTEQTNKLSTEQSVEDPAESLKKKPTEKRKDKSAEMPTEELAVVGEVNMAGLEST